MGGERRAGDETAAATLAADTPLARFCAAGSGAPESAAPRTVLVLAHQDDEVVGSGGRLPHLRDATVVHVTDGSPRDLRDAHRAGFTTREGYAAARRAERAAALALAGIGPEGARDVGLVDMEASLSLAALARRVAALLDALRPEVVVTHPYEGGHPDHDATAFAVHAARALLRRDGAAVPALLEQTSYHNRGGAMATRELLPHPGSPVATVALDEPHRALKRRMFDCYATQAWLLAAFPIDVERFRAAPRYDFTRPPHEGVLWYELFDWGMTGPRWRALAAEALASLGLGAHAP